MQLIQGDILAAGNGLSPGAAGFLVFVGLLLWAVGWRWHRFWVVFGITLAAGLLGLGAGRAVAAGPGDSRAPSVRQWFPPHRSDNFASHSRGKALNRNHAVGARASRPLTASKPRARELCPTRTMVTER